MDTRDLETMRLMAAFKMIVKKTLQKSVDLEALARDPEYARTCLTEVENAADNEDLLVLVLQLRSRLVSDTVTAVEPKKDEAADSRNYKFGARSW